MGGSLSGEFLQPFVSLMPCLGAHLERTSKSAPRPFFQCVCSKTSLSSRPLWQAPLLRTCSVGVEHVNNSLHAGVSLTIARIAPHLPA